MKRIRLDAGIYAQEGRACHVTICSVKGKLLFTVDAFTVHCIEQLESLAQEYAIFNYAYCFMPDHLHMVISVRGQKSIIDLVRAFKSLNVGSKLPTYGACLIHDAPDVINHQASAPKVNLGRRKSNPILRFSGFCITFGINRIGDDQIHREIRWTF